MLSDEGFMRGTWWLTTLNPRAGMQPETMPLIPTSNYSFFWGDRAHFTIT